MKSKQVGKYAEAGRKFIVLGSGSWPVSCSLLGHMRKSFFVTSLVLALLNTPAALALESPSGLIGMIDLAGNSQKALGALSAPGTCPSCEAARMPASDMSEAESGTETSGGGDLFDFEYDPQMVRDIGVAVKNSGARIKAAMRILEKKYGTKESVKKLLKDDKIFEIMKKATIEVGASGSCPDPQGIEKDASADVNTNTVCVSAARLSDKLQTKRGRPAFSISIAALVLHELAHLCGSNEEEAKSIQTMLHVAFSVPTNEEWFASAAHIFRTPLNVVQK